MCTYKLDWPLESAIVGYFPNKTTLQGGILYLPTPSLDTFDKVITVNDLEMQQTGILVQKNHQNNDRLLYKEKIDFWNQVKADPCACPLLCYTPEKGKQQLYIA